MGLGVNVFGFGGAVRVIAPVRLATDVLEQLERARARYVARTNVAMASMGFVDWRPRRMERPA
jgi:hypothetical protein